MVRFNEYLYRLEREQERAEARRLKQELEWEAEYELIIQKKSKLSSAKRKQIKEWYEQRNNSKSM